MEKNTITEESINDFTDQNIPSPCISFCKLDQEKEFCLGCGRTINEIKDWKNLTFEEKYNIIQRVKK